MRLLEIEVTNFRVYRGPHAIELADPEGTRNIHLFGGLNGAGKTSLLSAVVLGLYGGHAEGLAFERELGEDLDVAYQRFLRNAFCRSARTAGELEMSSRIVLESEGVDYEVTRTWWFDEGGSFEDEELLIYAGAQPLRVEADSEEERREILQQFIERLAPARIAKFFFFDGEEIKSIATTEPGQAVIDGLNQLLGFQALQRLSEDLDTLKRTIRRELPGASSSGLLEVHGELDDLRVRIHDRERQTLDFRRGIEGASEKLQAIDSEIEAMFGGQVVQSRSDALDALAAREREYARLTQEIQAFVADILTLTLPGKLLRTTARRAKQEAGHRRTVEARRRLRRVRDRLASDVFDGEGIPEDQRAALKRRFREAWDTHVESVDTAGTPRLNILSTTELERLPETVRETTETARRELLARLTRREHVQREMTRLRGVQSLFETGPRAQQLLEAKTSLLERRLLLEADDEACQKELTTLRSEYGARQAVAARMEEQLVTTEEVRAELDSIERVQRVLANFMRELRRRRAAALGEATNEMMRHLTHKEDLVARIQIDPESFRTRLLDAEGEEVASLSAGEREIFALSLVWGLAKISQRSLPMIIDTPLGRLDQMHRANVVEQFLPRASHQVLVLATDSEIDSRWHSRLQPSLAQEILIRYMEENASTSLIDGEFLELGSVQEVSDGRG